MNSEIVTGRNGEVQYVTIAEAVGGQSFANQIGILKNKFQNLTQNQREKCIIVDYDGNVYVPSNISTTNTYASFYKIAIDVDKIVFNTIRINEQKILTRTDMGTISDNSASISGGSLYLKMLV